jgi:hypothetical protein
MRRPCRPPGLRSTGKCYFLWPFTGSSTASRALEASFARRQFSLDFDARFKALEPTERIKLRSCCCESRQKYHVAASYQFRFGFRETSTLASLEVQHRVPQTRSPFGQRWKPDELVCGRSTSICTYSSPFRNRCLIPRPCHA